MRVLIGSAAFDEPRDQAVAFVVDLTTERKRAEVVVDNGWQPS